MEKTLMGYLTSPTCWLVVLGSFLCTLVLTPLVIWVAHKTETVRKSGYRRIHHHDTPLMGGIAIAVPFIVVTLLATTNLTGVFRSTGADARFFYLLAGGAATMALVGLMDDTIKLRARYKLLAQILVALVIALGGGAVGSVEIPLLGRVSFQGWPGLGVFVAVFWIVGVTNAVNLIDGMDGLATGVSLIMALALAAIAGINRDMSIVIPCIALVGSLAAFLIFNWHPAKIFLGDTGSLFLGFTLATIALFDSQKTDSSVMLLAAILALGVPIFETFISMARRYLGGFNMFVADDQHTHHRLLRQGFTQRQVALIMYAVAFVCMIAAIVQSLPHRNATLSASSMIIEAIPFVTILFMAGYVRSVIYKLKKRTDTKRKLTLAKYMGMRLGHGSVNGQAQRMLSMICDEFDLDALSVCFCGDSPSGVIHQTTALDTDNIQSRIGHFTLNGNSKTPIEVRYVHNTLPHEEDKHTTSVCLSSIFKQAVQDHIIGPDEHRIPPCQAPDAFIICDNKNPALREE